MPPVAEVQPLALTEPMKAWLHEHVSAVGTDDERMRRLIGVLSHELPLAYTTGQTRTAAEVFEEGRFNCLGLAHLMIAFGRELGVDAYDFRSYDARGPLVLSSTHIAAGWGPASNVQLVELDDVPDREKRDAVRITDREALALHYTNRGAELLLTDAPGVAHEWLDRALAIAPDLPEAWVDQGVALRRLGDLAGAERAYHEALDLDPDNLSAYRNLASLLELRGDPDAARELLDLATRPSNDNPYTWLFLGDLTVRTGDLSTAERFYRHGSRLDPRNPRLLAARAELRDALGDPERATELLERAVREDPDDPRVVAARQHLGG
jgi:Flp pilus assembly protein TadD